MDISGIYSPGIFRSWNLFLSWNFLFLESYFTEFTCYQIRVRRDYRLGLDFSYFSVQISRLGLVSVSKSDVWEFSVSSRSRKTILQNSRSRFGLEISIVKILGLVSVSQESPLKSLEFREVFSRFLSTEFNNQRLVVLMWRTIGIQKAKENYAFTKRGQFTEFSAKSVSAKSSFHCI